MQLINPSIVEISFLRLQKKVHLLKVTVRDIYCTDMLVTLVYNVKNTLLRIVTRCCWMHERGVNNCQMRNCPNAKVLESEAKGTEKMLERAMESRESWGRSRKPGVLGRERSAMWYLGRTGQKLHGQRGTGAKRLRTQTPGLGRLGSETPV